MNLSYLKVFSFVDYVHLASEDKNKIDLKFRKYNFIGYENDEFGNRFWGKEKRIIRSNNVIYSMRL